MYFRVFRNELTGEVKFHDFNMTPTPELSGYPWVVIGMWFCPLAPTS